MEVCPKSGLLISRCRCPDHRIPRRFQHAYLSRRQRQRIAATRYGQKELTEKQAAWMRNVWRAHAIEHPELWSDTAKRGFGLEDATDAGEH